MHIHRRVAQNGSATLHLPETPAARRSFVARGRHLCRLMALAGSLVIAVSGSVRAQQPSGAGQGIAQPTFGQSATQTQVAPRSAQLIGLIQTSVAPESWTPSAPPNAATNGIDPATQQLIATIQTHVLAATWSVNGGMGTIVPVPW